MKPVMTKVLLKVREKLCKLWDCIQDWFARTKHGKMIIKVTTFILILWFYLQFFLCPQIREYAKQRTTIATTFDDAETVNMPNLVICADPVFKSSVVNRFTNKYYSAEDLLNDKYNRYSTEHNRTLWEAFEDLTYDFETDFHLYHLYDDSNSYSNLFRDQDFRSFTQLKHGLNNNSNFLTKMSKIATYRHGMCCLLQPEYQESRGHKYLIQFTSKVTESGDRPRKFEIYFASPNSWQGVIDDEWLYFEPMKVEFLVHNQGDELNTEENWIFKTMVSELRYRSGNQDMNRCQTDEFLKANCTPKCFPLKYNFMNQSFPPCKTHEEAFCMIDQLYGAKYDNAIATCLKPLSTIQYKVDPYILADEKSNVFKDTFVLTFSFPLQTMQIEEEIKVISTADFIGYTGGALSLFIGFSCFDYFSRFLDKLYQRCHSKKYKLFLTDASKLQKV